MPAPDMSGVDPGLQPALIALLYLFPALALAVLLVRFWRKYVDGILGGGEILCDLMLVQSADRNCIDDVLIAIAWVLTLLNSVFVHLCKFSVLSYRSTAISNDPIVCVAVYTGYHEKDIPGYAIDFPRAFKVGKDPWESRICITDAWHTVSIRFECRIHPMRRLRQGVLLVESIQASIAQPMDQEIHYRSSSHQRHPHVFFYDNRGDTLLANCEIMAEGITRRVL
jgi:hypothetical protein